MIDNTYMNLSNFLKTFLVKLYSVAFASGGESLLAYMIRAMDICFYCNGRITNSGPCNHHKKK